MYTCPVSRGSRRVFYVIDKSRCSDFFHDYRFFYSDVVCRGRRTAQIKKKHIDLLVERCPSLETAKEDIIAAYLLLEESYENGGKLLVAENQELGSVLAENLQGALLAIALDGHLALSTAYMNDCEPLLCFAQQVNGYGKAGDVLLGISTSGNSKNILYAATTAHAKGMKVIGLTGAKDSKLKDMSDVCIKAPQTESYMIQELHLPIYHCLCLMLEDRFFATI